MASITNRKGKYYVVYWFDSLKNFYLCGDRVTEPTYGNGLMAPRVAICAGHEANMITRLLLGEEDV